MDREKLNLDLTKKTLMESLGISEERINELTDHSFCGLPEEHSIAEHVQAVANREDVTLPELLASMIDLGAKIERDFISQQVLKQALTQIH